MPLAGVPIVLDFPSVLSVQVPRGLSIPSSSYSGLELRSGRLTVRRRSTVKYGSWLLSSVAPAVISATAYSRVICPDTAVNLLVVRRKGRNTISI